MLPAFFTNWTERFRKTSPRAVESSRDEVRAWQKVLLQEQERLSQELTELLATYERSLNYFSAHVTDLDEESLERECRSLESIRSVLGNAIRRLEVSTKENHELQNEWQEWRAVRDTTSQLLEPVQEQRIEMIRSELVIRGVLPSPSQQAEEATSTAAGSRQTVLDVVPMDPVIFIQERLDNLDDWHTIQTRQLEAAHRYWSEQLEEGIAVAEREPTYAAAVIARFRAVQGERKALRRR